MNDALQSPPSQPAPGAAGLPEGLRTVELPEKTVFLLGTAHVSQKSVDDVRVASEALRPETICVELCPSRYQTIVNRDAWQKMNIFRVIRENKALFLLVQLILSLFYKKIAEKLGVQPGAEMVEAIRQAETQGARLVLADRDVNVTLKRVWGYLGFWQKLKLLFQLLLSLFAPNDLDEDVIEDLKSKDQLEVVMDSVAKSFPEVKKRLIDERDLYLAQKIREAPGRSVLAVVGAGHVQGILEHIEADREVAPLLSLPPASMLPKILKWGIPLAIVALIVLGFFKGGTTHSVESIAIWVLVNGTFSALGVVLALAHPLTVLSTFLAAPLTSLNPTIAAGWVAGLVQAWVKKPTVADLEILPATVTSIKGFWMNPLSRILLVVVLANLGSSVGTFLAGSWIAARFF